MGHSGKTWQKVMGCASSYTRYSNLYNTWGMFCTSKACTLSLSITLSIIVVGKPGVLSATPSTKVRSVLITASSNGPEQRVCGDGGRWGQVGLAVSGVGEITSEWA